MESKSMENKIMKYQSIKSLIKRTITLSLLSVSPLLFAHPVVLINTFQLKQAKTPKR